MLSEVMYNIARLQLLMKQGQQQTNPSIILTPHPSYRNLKRFYIMGIDAKKLSEIFNHLLQILK